MNSTNISNENFIFILMRNISVCKTNLAFTSISGFLVIYSFFYYYLNSTHKLKFNNVLICLYSSVMLTHCIATFIFRSKLIRFESDSSFLLILWLTSCVMSSLSFALFLEQRKNFYKKTALVNNTPTFIVSLEKLLMSLEIITETSRYMYVVIDVVSGLNSKSPCYIGVSKHFAFWSVVWIMILKIGVALLMLQPVLTFWSRLKISSTNRFSFLIRLQVFKPVICSLFWVFSQIVYTLPYLIGRLSNYPCKINLELFYILTQFVHMSNLLVLIIAVQAKLPKVVLKCLKRYKK